MMRYLVSTISLIVVMEKDLDMDSHYIGRKKIRLEKTFSLMTALILQTNSRFSWEVLKQTVLERSLTKIFRTDCPVICFIELQFKTDMVVIAEVFILIIPEIRVLSCR